MAPKRKAGSVVDPKAKPKTQPEAKKAKQEEKKPEEKKQEEKKPEEKKPVEKKPEEKKPVEKKPEEKKPEEKKPEERSVEPDPKPAPEEKTDGDAGKAAPDDESGEKEKDASPDKRPVLKDSLTFHHSGCTLNVIPTFGGQVLSALSDGGMQYLIAGARANVGIKTGRYMFEVRIVEMLNPAEFGGRGQTPRPKQLVRVGFSTQGSSLILGDGDPSICFDSEGFCLLEKKRTSISQRFVRDQVIGVLLNRDSQSPNKDTISLFRNGVRVSQPVPLPENLKGQPLFPHVAFRNVSLQVHFGPQPLRQLPFKCRTIQDAAQQDVLVVKETVPKDGKYEVLFPVGFPDEGTFSWLDMFLEKNPQYVELSDRKIQEWAMKSGLWRPRGQSWRSSNDKPEFNYGLPMMDDFSVHRAINAIVSLVPRNYVVMEVKSNLVPDDRQELVKRFSRPSFKRVACVVMGEPSQEYKDKIKAELLEEKKVRTEVEWRRKKVEMDRKKEFEKRQRDMAEKQNKLAEHRKKIQEDAKRKAEEKKKTAEGGDDDDDDDKAADATMEEEAKEDATMEEKEDDDEFGDSPPEVKLDEEEENTWFKKPGLNDITIPTLNMSFAKFSLPDKKEGFDEVRYEWQDAQASAAYLKKWVLDRKRTTRVEDLVPGTWFKDKLADFQQTLQEWQKSQSTYKASKKKAGKSGGGDDEEDDFSASIDIFNVDDVTNIGGGEPLFAEFAFEDWSLTTLRFELFLLMEGFKRDVDDPDRLRIPEVHFHFYYNRYLKKQMVPKSFGKETIQELFDLVRDTVTLEDGELVSQLSEDTEKLDIFVKITEQNRRERQRRIDAGDETVRLKFPVAVPRQVVPPVQKTGVGVPVVQKTVASAGGGPVVVQPRAMAGVVPPTHAAPLAAPPRLAAAKASGWQAAPKVMKLPRV